MFPSPGQIGKKNKQSVSNQAGKKYGHCKSCEAEDHVVVWQDYIVIQSKPTEKKTIFNLVRLFMPWFEIELSDDINSFRNTYLIESNDIECHHYVPKSNLLLFKRWEAREGSDGTASWPSLGSTTLVSCKSVWIFKIYLLHLCTLLSLIGVPPWNLLIFIKRATSIFMETLHYTDITTIHKIL